MAVKLSKEVCENKLYLTDAQYLSILRRIEETVLREDFKPYCHNSVTVGNKFTESNCGLCNSEYTEKETALFPEDFPQRKSMKYRRKGQICPFDMRKNVQGYGWGCFYNCYLFKNAHRKTWNIDLMQQMVKDLIKEKE